MPSFLSQRVAAAVIDNPHKVLAALAGVVALAGVIACYVYAVPADLAEVPVVPDANVTIVPKTKAPHMRARSSGIPTVRLTI